jgi:hypothetical protein
MKKLTILVILFSSVLSLKAQKAGSYGISAGINVSKVILKYNILTSGLTPIAGFKGYFFYDLPLSKSFSLQNELGYDGMGFKYMALPGSSERYTQTFDYITLSILPKFNLPPTGLSFFAGPSLGYLFHANSTGGGKSISSTDDFYPIEVFGVLGEEYIFPMGLGITFRYMYGLTNIAKGYTFGGYAHNSVFSFTLAYKFNSGK